MQETEPENLGRELPRQARTTFSIKVQANSKREILAKAFAGHLEVIPELEKFCEPRLCNPLFFGSRSSVKIYQTIQVKTGGKNG